MNLGQRDGRNRNQQWTTEFDVDGSRTYDSYSHWEIYGRSGRLRKFREVSWDENGKTIHLTRSTKKNPDKLDKTRVRGGRYR